MYSVLQMGKKVVNWGLAGHAGLRKEAQHGEHGKSPIVDLLSPHRPRLLSRALGHPHEVEEGTTRVHALPLGTSALKPSLDTQKPLLGLRARVLVIPISFQLSKLHHPDLNPKEAPWLSPKLKAISQRWDDSSLPP